MSLYTWDEVRKHIGKDSRWIVIDSKVYDVTRWQHKHPGGTSVLGNYAGQDASEPFRAFHPEPEAAVKYFKSLEIGRISSSADELTNNSKSSADINMKNDIIELRETAEKMGLFKTDYRFYLSHVAQVLIADILAFSVLWIYGFTWSAFIASILFHSLAQGICDWLQHDFGHSSVFKTARANKRFHIFLMNFIKGASATWWSNLHNRHHSKPNVIDKDPDVKLDLLFVVGDDMPVSVAKSRKNSMPFNIQHKYFPFLGPPLLFPVYFQFMVFYFLLTRKLWKELMITLLYYVRYIIFTYPILGLGWMFVHYEAFRIIESHWFTWVSQSNHIPMAIEEDKEEAWLQLQLKATCNIEHTAFNDWFTGHLNFQIEHHIFPTMPRHNYHKLSPLVQSLCSKYGIEYKVKPLGTAFLDILRSLQKSGEIWWSAYKTFHVI